MIAILSPAKNLNTEKLKKEIKNTSQPQFLSEAEILMQQLKKMKAKDISKFMKLSPKLADLNYERFQNWDKKHTDKNAKPAILTFNGDAYTGLQADDFIQQDLDYAQKHIKILSGLYGLLSPLDIIQAYRLEMGKPLKTKGNKDLYGFWGNKISTALNTAIAESGSPYLVNVASNEYFKAVQYQKINATVINCTFKEYKNGEYKSVMVFLKKARGYMCRFIVKNKINNPEDLIAFEMDGYVYNPKLSKENDLVFTR